MITLNHGFAIITVRNGEVSLLGGTSRRVLGFTLKLVFTDIAECESVTVQPNRNICLKFHLKEFPNKQKLYLHFELLTKTHRVHL